jgi:glutamate synthase domain-containing protein 2
MLVEEQQANGKYFYELASAKFGFDWDQLKNVQAFHFKGGQGAKTGTGGHLSGNKVTGKIADVRNLKEETPAISPPTFDDLHTAENFIKAMALGADGIALANSALQSIGCVILTTVQQV